MSNLDKLFEHAPEGATELYQEGHEFSWFNDKGQYFDREDRDWCDSSIPIGENEILIATRPQLGRKTVEDAVAAFPDGFSATYKKGGVGDWIGYCTKDIYGGTKKGQYTDIDRALYNKGYFQLVCPLSEFEDNLAAKGAEGEPEWTHRTIFGELCKIHTDEPDVNGVIIVLNEKGEYSRHNSDSLKEIKPTKPQITKAEAEGRLGVTITD